MLAYATDPLTAFGVQVEGENVVPMFVPTAWLLDVGDAQLGCALPHFQREVMP